MPPGPHQWNIRLRQAPLKPEQTNDYIQPGGFSQWVELPDAALGRDWLNQVTIGWPEQIIVADNDLVVDPDSEMVIEIASQPDSTAIVKRIPIILGPNHPVAAFWLNRSLIQPVAREATEIALETQEEVRRLLDENPVFGKRPEKFPVAISFAPLRTNLPGLWQGVLPRQAWETELQTLEMLGINGLYWQIGPELKARGFVHNAVQAYYWPPFPSEEAVENFVQGVAGRISDADAWGDVSSISMFEENGGPDMKVLIEGDKHHTAAEYREHFITYLKQKGIGPFDLGKAGWNEVRIVSVEEAASEPELFYHSALFRPWVITNTVNRVADHASRHFKKPLMMGVFTSDAYARTGSMLRQGIDLFRWIREAPGVSDLSSEGWKNLSPTYEMTAWEMAVARAATRYKETPRPGLLNILNRAPADILTNVYVALAQGANHLYHFGWGPWYAQSDGASNRPEIAPALRQANYAIGALEDLLTTDHVRPAEVAILYSFPTDAWSWAQYDRSPFWLYENVGVFLSLAHQQIPADLLIDEDILQGELAKYKVLYLVGPNTDAKVARSIADWVKAGGIVVGTAGAGIRDQYNRPLDTLNPVFGAIQRASEMQPKLDMSTQLATYPWQRGQFIPPDGGTPFPIGGVRVSVEPGDAQVLARFSDDAPALMENAFGKGRAYLIAGSLGFTYLLNAVKNKVDAAGSTLYRESYNPVRYSAAIRDVINLPAMRASISKPVEIDAPGVHAGLRVGPKGATVVLVNYPRQDRKNMIVQVNDVDSAKIRTVTSTALGKELAFVPVGKTGIRIDLPRLGLIEMIGIHFQ